MYQYFCNRLCGGGEEIPNLFNSTNCFSAKCYFDTHMYNSVGHAPKLVLKIMRNLWHIIKGTLLSGKEFVSPSDKMY